MTSLIGRAVTSDGMELLTRHWPTADPWASLLLIHGLGEHSGRYEHVGEQFASAGIDTHAYDHRGNGGSSGRRGDIERWSQYHNDHGERLAAVRSTSGGRPVVLYAHSMGGLVAAAPGGGNWFHQHFSVGAEPMRFINYWGGPDGQWGNAAEEGDGEDVKAGNVYGIEAGGRSINYWMEDPYIRELFASKLRANGVEPTMPERLYQKPADRGDTSVLGFGS